MSMRRLLLLAAALASSAPVAAVPRSGAPRALPFQDDYARAVAEARARKVPLFVEAWAPW